MKSKGRILKLSIIIVFCMVIILPIVVYFNKDYILNAEEYTWEDYQELSSDEKAIFPDNFENQKEFKKWKDSAKQAYEKNATANDEIPSINLNEKDPSNYTWEDYQKLSVDEKAVFPDYFENMDEYYKWYNNVKPVKE